MDRGIDGAQATNLRFLDISVFQRARYQDQGNLGRDAACSVAVNKDNSSTVKQVHRNLQVDIM